MTQLLGIKGLIIIGLIILVIIIVIIIASRKKTVEDKYVVDSAYIVSILEALGQITNIASMSIDNRRLAFNLISIKLADFDKLKELSNTGAFVVGNTVKVLFKYDSEKIKREIEKRGKKQ